MSWLRTAARLKLFFICLWISLDCFAWSAKGHEWIAEKAFEQLSQEELQYYQELIELLDIGEAKASPVHKRKNLPLIAVYPDRIRDVSLEQLFLQNAAILPEAFIDRAEKNTSTWHYHNEVERTQDNAHCRFQNRGELLIILEEIDKALGARLTKRQEALLVSFQIHLIQDLHQPLHTFTKLSYNCKSDLGGNKTCFRMGFFGKCKVSLHAFWDSGFDVFEKKIPVIIDAMPLESLSESIEEFLPRLWLQENQRYYRDVYEINYPDYFDGAQIIATERIGLAVSRLTYYLKLHHKRKTYNAST